MFNLKTPMTSTPLALVWGAILVSFWLAMPALADEGTDEFPEPGSNSDLVLEVNINTDDVDTLAQLLPGVGPTRAEAIVTHREEYGPFANAEDLLAVNGIGPATLEAIRDQVRVDTEELAAEAE
ncbi:MAG: helix-hairpin-helix domain-containing protein [Natronospirillum sp.]|uniref:ComEA family DNA-binding protein n=1 Tax=Natronospirillum sp. TaxID=2812955 RepID=UPI0025D19B17|nr:helix-hairpin-helix domain-containing protein [Natronospirillum sp.]MCH8552412.1 helix-hairpin-helix domain-containing protein [Natronospirillum sp.]